MTIRMPKAAIRDRPGAPVERVPDALSRTEA